MVLFPDTLLKEATSFINSQLSAQCVQNGLFGVTFRMRSCSSTTPSSLPVAWAIRFPATKLPTSIEAGPTST